jgi:peroxiredoxin
VSWPWPAPKDDGAARHLVRGLPLPDIGLAATSGEVVSLARFPGRAVVFCYPWTGRPGLANPPDWDTIPGAHGSTPEAEDFRNLHSAFAEIGVEIYGLSGQSTDDQREFAQRIKLPFVLLSDADLRLCKALRLPTFETGGVTYVTRLTLVVRDARLERAHYPVHPPHAHAREVLAWITAAGSYADEARLRPSGSNFRRT